MKLTESPQERLKSVGLVLFTDPSGPNILLGALVSATLQYVIGMVPWTWPAVAGLAWASSVLVYAYVDEVQTSIEERRNRLLDPESAYYGIE